ncbi:HugZ family pyridoxamine 5'-phosphate oxidase [Roseixanthobacter glucoisosaccharinicivorans]|uniref:HugZ family pyridoxamine 5'-phosphate oxidase n=1 Tax=Roseixanthobacter glucoisosaccharinicivorans TaxID=3119923 RepID=UPI00372810DC
MSSEMDTDARAVRMLMHEAGFATLATLEDSGAPHASLVAMALDEEGQPVLLLSRLARHTRNFLRDPRVSLLVTAPAGADPLDAGRASLLGRISLCDDADARARFLARHASAGGYADFGDFAFYRVGVGEAHLVQGFGRILTVPGPAIVTDWTGAEAVRAAQTGIIAHMNADHADAIALYAQKLVGAQGEGWSMAALDPMGCDLRRGAAVLRLEFPERVTSVAAVRQVLVALVERARNAA